MYYQRFSKIEGISLPVYYPRIVPGINPVQRSPFDRAQKLIGVKSFLVDRNLTEVTVDLNPRDAALIPDYIYLLGLDGKYIFEAFPLELIELRRGNQSVFMWEFFEPVDIDLSSSYCLTNSRTEATRNFLNLIIGYA